MNGMSWASLGLGLSTGAVAAALYLAGLALGIRWALRGAKAAPVLLCSAIVRIALLLAAGVGLARLGTAPLAGFAVGFVLVRLVVVATLRPRGIERSAPWS